MSLVARTEWWHPMPAVEEPLGIPSSQPGRRSGGGLAFRAVVVFTFIMLLGPQDFLPALRPFRIALLAAVVGIVASLADSILRGRPLTVGGPEMVLTASLVAWAVVTLPLSYWPGGSVSLLLDMYLKTVAIFWLLANVVDTVPRLRRVAWALTVMSVPLALTGVRNFLSGEFLEATVAQGVGRIVGYEAGLIRNPNDLALILTLILPLSVALLLAARSALARASLLVILALQVAGVVVTFSRGGFLCLFTVAVIYLCRLARRGRAGWAATGLAFCLLGLAVLPAGYLTRLATIADIDSDPTGSAQARWNDSAAAVGYVLDHPLIGAGVGMNTLALNEVRGSCWKEVHNVYLQYATDLGLPGLMLFLLLFVACLRKVRAVRRRAEAVPAWSELAWLAGGIEIALLAFAVAAFFSPVAYHFHFYYLAGLAVAASGVQRRLSTQDQAEIHP
jgi:O-antigen ligase